MKVTVSTVIYGAMDDVVFAVIDNDELINRKECKTIELVKGINNTNGAVSILTNHVGTTLTRTIEDIELPNMVVYSIKEVHTRYEHNFREHDDHVHYKLIVSSNGSWLFNILANIFKSKTETNARKMMDDLKTYIESKNQKAL